MTAREIKRRIPRKAAVATGLMAVLLAVGSALAFHDGTVAIELDGNVASDGSTPGVVDWADLFLATGADAGLPSDDQLGSAGNDIDREFKVDFVAGASGPDDSYHEPSNKDNQPVFATGGSNVWGCVSAKNPTDKDDILNAYAIAYTGQGEDAGDLILSFGVERYDDSGTAYLGFWVFQKDVTCNTATGKFEGAKTDNDILMLINFSNGGDNVTINAFAWHPGTPATSADGTFTTIGTGVGCNVSVDPGGTGTPVNMCAITNGIGDQNVVTPWPTEDKTKPGAPNPDPVNTLEPPEFVEGAINLTEAFAAARVTPPACFGAFMAETRSSDTLAATLKDFALGDLNTCNGSVSITGNGTNRVGTAHTFTVTATQSTGGGTVPATTGHVDVTLTGSDGINNTGDIDIDADASTCDDAGDNLDNVTGTCVIVFNSTETGKVTGHASVVIDLGGGSTLTRDTDPATTTIDEGPNGSETPAVKTYVDATIDITGDGTNRVGVAHFFTATVKKDIGDGNGLLAASGQIVTVSRVDTLGATSVVDDTPDTDSTCDDGTNSSGQCVVKFSSATTGVTTGSASTTVTFGAMAPFVITTANDAEVLGNESVVKTWVDAALDITGDGTNRAGTPHTFTVTAYADDGDGTPFLVLEGGVLVTVDFTEANGTDPISDAQCTTSSTAGPTLGTCIVTFNSTKTGTHTGTASASISAGPAGAQISIAATSAADSTTEAAADALKNWVNARIGIVGNDTNSIEETHTFTVTLQKDLSAAGSYVAANGEDVNVTLTSAAGATYILDTTATTCDVVGAGQTFTHTNPDTDVNGQCIVVFTSNLAGTVTGSATSTLTVETVGMTVSTGDATSTSAATVLKTFLDGSLTWLKHDGDGFLLGGATFEVCRLSRLNSNTGLYIPEDVDPIAAGNQPYCFTVFDADTNPDSATAPDTDVTAGEIVVIDLVLGRYTVRETIPPTGYHIAVPPGAGPFNFPDMTIVPLVVDVNMANGTTGGIANPPAFVNIRAYRIIVITCDDITDTLVVSTVTFDSVDYDSMSATELATWNAAHGDLGLTEGMICGSDTDPSLGGAASFGDLEAGTYDIRVKVPKAS